MEPNTIRRSQSAWLSKRQLDSRTQEQGNDGFSAQDRAYHPFPLPFARAALFEKGNGLPCPGLNRSAQRGISRVVLVIDVRSRVDENAQDFDLIGSCRRDEGVTTLRLALDPGPGLDERLDDPDAPPRATIAKAYIVGPKSPSLVPPPTPQARLGSPPTSIIAMAISSRSSLGEVTFIKARRIGLVKLP